MASLDINNSQAESAKFFQPREAPAGPACAPAVAESPTFARETFYLSQSCAEGLNCLKGCLIAIALEAAAALCIVGVWLVWRI